MSAEIRVSVDVRERQRRAADPARSVWVSANAGAGKTKVLTDRVIRLMLDGSPPSRILCLTFTKAAAAEMTIRVFETLGDWVTLDDPALGRALADLTGEPAGRDLRRRARQLFAQAIETPGGLKIETIHAFCERLLHLVPFEAGVPARFAVLDDAQSAELAAEARAAILTAAMSGDPRHDAVARALDEASAQLSGDGLLGLIDRAAADPRVPGDPDEIAQACRRLAAAMGLRPGETAADIRREAVADGIAPAEWPAIAAELDETGRAADATAAGALRLALQAATVSARFDHYGSVFFTDKGPPRKDVATKAAPAGLRAALAAEQARLVALEPRLRAACAVERSRALFTLAGAVGARTDALKRRLGALDFADLITRTLALFERGNGPWVLYKLDRGIDHLLVDEAQDTNEPQWQILRRLTEEFTAGAGRPARRRRTVFAVGDPKQSIYSFQGADPRLFEDSRRHWSRLHAAADLGFDDVRLDLSFRSAQALLDTVDHTFRVPAHFRGLSFADAAIGTAHFAARTGAPGQVEIWPTEGPSPKPPEPDAWSQPVDRPDPGSPALRAAARVAAAIRCWTAAPDPLTGRTWRPGDILVLARKRGPAFFATIRAIKGAGVPVAGADRLDLGEEIAINDLVAAGQAAILPLNDLVLAAALKSPLAGLDDDDLIRIAADRPDGQSLWAALEAAAGADPRARCAFETVAGWRDLARRHGPFGFYATLLGPGGGRRRLVERLGGEAADTIDVFLCRAKAEEAGLDTPSLTSFLARFETHAHVIKRDPEAAGDEVRVMTVHGAKGLEAPLVVVLDGCEVGGEDPDLIGVPVGGNGDLVPVWAGAASADPPLLAEARAAFRARALEEHNRLLYVALTRARDRLVLVPFAGGRGTEPEEAWCAMVRRGFAEATRALVRTEMPYGPVDLWQDRRAGEPDEATRPGPQPVAIPDWLTRPADAEPDSPPPLRPSGPLPAADRSAPPRAVGPSRTEARQRGVLVHALVDHLANLGGPAAPGGRDRSEAADLFLRARAARLDEAQRRHIAAEARRTVEHPDLAPIFGPGSRGEVAISGRVGPAGRERLVDGQMDRVLIEPDRITVADLKTGSAPADGSMPESYLRQLAIYRALLAEAYPGRRVRTLLVWTSGPAVVEPDPAALDAALARWVASLP